MRQLPSSEMVDHVALFAVLLIFFSIDLRGRDLVPESPWTAHLFSWLSRIGGISTALTITVAWVSIFIPEDSSGLHVAWVAVPGTAAILCAVALGVEMLFVRSPAKSNT